MHLNKIQHQNFQRALTSKELSNYKATIKKAKEELGIEDTTVIAFDFSYPTKKCRNTGIGTSFSDYASGFNVFLKNTMGINSVQLQPQGKISKGNVSPYSGTNFALGKHIIDLNLLTTQEYGNLLDDGYIASLDYNYPKNKTTREYRTDYNWALTNQEEALKMAWENFKKSQSPKLKKEFREFKKENSSWLEYEALFTILSKKYGTTNFSEWEETDKNLYNNDFPLEIRQRRIQELKNTHKEEIDYENFTQFILDKQQKFSKEKNNQNGIKLYGDDLIGFSQSEVWGNKACFKDNEFYGATESSWGVGAPDYSKIGKCNGKDTKELGETGRFLYNTFVQFFKRYDGVRIDAAWQFVTPIIYNQYGEKITSKGVDDTVFNIIKLAAKNVYKEKFDENNPDNIMVEMVGRSSVDGAKLTKNIYPQLYTTLLEYKDKNPKYRESEEGLKAGKYYIGTSCHDNESLVNNSRNVDLRESHFYQMKNDYNLNEDNLGFICKEYQSQNMEQKRQEDFKTAKLAEIFTTSKQFFTLPDAFGMQEKINMGGVVDDSNWTVRIPTDYERFYYTQLSNGYGLNLPKVLDTAMEMKNIKNPVLSKKLKDFSEILRQKGPMTTKEANKLEKEQKLKKTFDYKI